MKPSQPKVRKFEAGMMETILRRELAALGYEMRMAHGGKNCYNLSRPGQKGRPRKVTIRDIFDLVNPVRVKRGDEPLTISSR
jgi:hypothetical protein